MRTRLWLKLLRRSCSSRVAMVVYLQQSAELCCLPQPLGSCLNFSRREHNGHQQRKTDAENNE